MSPLTAQHMHGENVEQNVEGVRSINHTSQLVQWATHWSCTTHRCTTHRYRCTTRSDRMVYSFVEGDVIQLRIRWMAIELTIIDRSNGQVKLLGHLDSILGVPPCEAIHYVQPPAMSS